MKMPLVVGLSGKMRCGKDTVANLIIKEPAFANIKIRRMALADALKREVNEAAERAGGMKELIAALRSPQGFELSSGDYLKAPEWVVYNPSAPIDDACPYGKQRTLLQFWGTDFRRFQYPFYWVDQIKETIKASDAEVVLLTDLRFKNEFTWLSQNGGMTVKIERPVLEQSNTSATAKHSSETELDDMVFDYTLVNDGDLEHLRQKAIKLFLEILKVPNSHYVPHHN